MNFVKSVLTVALALTFISCSSKSKSTDPSASTGPAMKGSGNAADATTSESELLERYSIVELNSVANALRIIFEKSTDPKADQADQILDCAMTADDAKKLSNPLKVLMETQQEREREAYTMDPGVYARSHGLETCGAKCACGALAGVLKPVSAKTLKLPAQKVAHERFVKRLQAKASRQTAEESLTCARKTSWFCNSDLKAYLEKEASKTP